MTILSPERIEEIRKRISHDDQFEYRSEAAQDRADLLSDRAALITEHETQVSALHEEIIALRRDLDEARKVDEAKVERAARALCLRSMAVQMDEVSPDDKVVLSYSRYGKVTGKRWQHHIADAIVALQAALTDRDV